MAGDAKEALKAQAAKRVAISFRALRAATWDHRKLGNFAATRPLPRMKLFLISGFALATVMACVGWGRIVEKAIGRAGSDPQLPRLSTGIAGCLGLAAFLCGAGAFVAINQYRPVFAWLWILVGCMLAIWTIARSKGAWNTTPTPRGLWIATVGALGAISVYEVGNSLGTLRWNPCDDFVAYVPLLHRLTQTGGMIEPFSLRRITGLGGATISDSLFTATFGLNAAYVGDFAVGALLVGLLVLIPSSNWPRFLLGPVLIISFALWENLRANLTPAYIVVALTTAAVLVVIDIQRSRANLLLDRRALALLGLLCAGLLTLRTPDAVPVALFVLVLVVRAGATYRVRFRAALFFPLVTGLLALPWMIALWRSSGRLCIHRSPAISISHGQGCEFLAGISCPARLTFWDRVVSSVLSGES